MFFIRLHFFIWVLAAVKADRKFCDSDYYDTNFQSLYADINIVLQWKAASVGSSNYIKKICSTRTGLPLKRNCLYNRATDEAEWEFVNITEPLIHCLLIKKLCVEETFIHHYIMKNNSQELYENKWKSGHMSGSIGLYTPCLLANGISVTRKCTYNVNTASFEWESLKEWPPISCYREIRQLVVSKDLNDLHNKILETKKISTEYGVEISKSMLKILTKSKRRLLPADIQISGQILKALTELDSQPQLMRSLVNVMNVLMSTDSTVLKLSAELNAPNICLKTFENYVDKSAAIIAHECLASPENRMILSKNIGIFILRPSCTNISGIAVYSGQTRSHSYLHYDRHSGLFYRYLYLNQSVTELLDESYLLLATYVPEDLWTKMINEYWQPDERSVVIIKIYKNDKLFVETKTVVDYKPSSAILSISISNYNGLLVRDLPIIFARTRLTVNMKQPTTHEQIKCGFWNYSAWDTRGITVAKRHLNRLSEEYVLCYTNHLTPFSYLIEGAFEQPPLQSRVLISLPHIHLLDVISMIGCAMSLLGLSGIWLTAFSIKNWCRQASNQVLLHMCAVLTLIKLLFIAVNTNYITDLLVDKQNFINCTIIGAVLQYVILVLFVWMMVVAILQFQRYVTVIGVQRPNHYITKAAVVAWSLPLIPTLYVAIKLPNCYIPKPKQLITNTGICYPSGSGLMFGVVIPIALLVSVNVIIYVYILYSLTRSSCLLKHTVKKHALKEVRLFILLFFLLGLSWIFGILAYMKFGITFSYLFCISATLQGFILFLYFVILDESTRCSWLGIMCPKRFAEYKIKGKLSIT